MNRSDTSSNQTSNPANAERLHDGLYSQISIYQTRLIRHLIYIELVKAPAADSN